MIMSNLQESALNALDERYIPILDPAYVDGYNKVVKGHVLAHQVTVEEYRRDPPKYFRVWGGHAGPEVGKVYDVKCKVDDGEIVLRVYEPKERRGKRPVHLNFHGGGWVVGWVGMDDAWIRHLVDRTGAVVIDVDYRLAPEYPAPACTLDGFASVQWVLDHASELDIDVNRISVGGISAGGNIAAVLSHMCRDMGLRLCFQLLCVPVTDATALNTDSSITANCPYKSWSEMEFCPMLPHARMKWFYDYWLGTDPQKRKTLAHDWKISPMLAKRWDGLPPAFIVTADVDVLRDEGEAYGKLLEKHGIPTEIKRYMGVPHSFMSQVEVLQQAREYVDDTIGALAAAYIK